jgi:DNA-binding NtrC family response regulator
MGKDLPLTSEGVMVSGEKAGVEFVAGMSPSMLAVEAIIHELAQNKVPVLLLAERGAGKQVTAQRIHEMSQGRARLFRIVHCGSLNAEEMPSLMAGDDGLRQGTIFLKDIAELSRDCQVQMLKAWPKSEDHGSDSSAGVRLICGSTRDLELEVKAGRLREDLYYRISGVCLRLPPLRQRREDIPLLTEHFLRKCAQEFHRPVPQLSAETHRLFQEYSWPGNLRELEDAAKAIVALGNESIAMGGLRALLQGAQGGGNGRVSLKQAARAASREAEKELILKVLTRTRWNRRRAAEELQISYKALLYKLKQIGCTEYGAS